LKKVFEQIKLQLAKKQNSLEIEAYICSIGDLVLITSKAESVDTQVRATAEITTSLIVPFLEFCCTDTDIASTFFVKTSEKDNGDAIRATVYKLFKDTLFIEGMMNGSMEGHVLN